jgi:hypothetical protein
MRDFLTAQFHSKTSAKTNGLDLLAMVIFFWPGNLRPCAQIRDNFFGLDNAESEPIIGCFCAGI